MIDDIASPAPGFLTVAEAARRLSVSGAMVRHLLGRDELRGRHIGKTWLVREEDVERRRSLRPGRGRRLTPARAWGLLFLAAGMPASWLDAAARYRLRRLLAERGLPALRPKLIDRASRRAYRAHPSQLQPLRRDPAVMLTGSTAATDLRLGLVGEDVLEAYVDEAVVDEMVHRFHLRDGRDPNVLLRVVPTFTPGWPPAHYAPLPVIALDLLDDPDPRVRQVGAELLEKAGR